jgi:single-strand DNA-binding protein
VGRQAQLLRRHRLGQSGRKLRAVPGQGPAAIDGRLDWREWDAQDGTKRQAVEIIAENVQFLGSRESSGESSSFVPQGTPAANADFGPTDDDIPF